MLQLLILCITSSFLSTGSVTGYQLAKYQLLPGMDVEKIRSQLEALDLHQFNQEEVAAAKFYLKAYQDGFEEKRYYNFYTQEYLGKW